jgi:lysophospholipase L1-like esterase
MLSLSAHAYKTIETKFSPSLEVSEIERGIHLQSTPSGKHKAAVSYAWRVVKESEIGDANAVSFKIKSEQDPFLASVFLGQSKVLLNAHEASVYVDSNTWKDVTLPFQDFVRNQKPWSVKKMDGQKLTIDSSKIRAMGFGRGFQFNHYDRKDYAFSVKDIAFTRVEARPSFPVRHGLNETTRKLQAGEPVDVLLLGDSITYQGKEQSHFAHALQFLKTNSEVNIKNMAVGGHSVRGGQIVLPRSIAHMSRPDLVVIMYGANDCKAIHDQSGFDSDVFAQQLELLILAVNRELKGQCEFLILNGVPRVDRETMISTGLVEKLTAGHQAICEKYKLKLCDTMNAYITLSATDKKRYYKDTIHQNQKGLAYMGKCIAKLCFPDLLASP